MLANPVWFIVFHRMDDLTASAEGAARLVVSALDTYSDDDLSLAATAMGGPKVADMKTRLSGLRKQLHDAGNVFEMAVRSASQTGDDARVVVPLNVSQVTELPPELQHRGAIWLDTDDGPWAVTTEAAWRVTDFVPSADLAAAPRR